MKTFDQIREKLGMATAGEHEDAAHAHRTASKQPKQDLRAVKAHEKAADHHDTAAKHLRNGDSYAASRAHSNAKDEADKAKDYGNVHSSRAHADTRAIGEGYVKKANLAELSPELLTRYTKKAIPRQFKAQDRARDYGMRGTAKGDKLQHTADKRKKGIDSVRKRSNPNDKGQSKTGRASRPHGGMRPGKGSPYQQKSAGGFNSKYLDQ